MAKKISTESSLGVIMPCAILVVGMIKKEFRPKDLIFFIDLVKDVLMPSRHGFDISVQTIQVQRWLKRYVAWDWLMIRRRGRYETYHIKSEGLKGLAATLTSPEQHLDIQEALLIQELLDAYGPLLRAQIPDKNALGKAEPWLELLLAPKTILRRQWQILKKTIAHHERRQKESLQLQKYCQDGLAKGRSLEELLTDMPAPYSYSRQHQKPLGELLLEVPRPVAEFEMRKGFALRQERFYTPTLEYLYMQQAFYEKLLQISR